MKKIRPILSFLLVGMHLAGLTQVTPYTCGSAQYLNQLDQAHPGLKDIVEKITDHAGYRSRSGTVTVPIVFHVVYNTSTQNLANNYLTAQVDQLNQCYARQNADTVNMRSIYKSRVGASKIRFVLDQIIRVSTTNTSFDASSTSGFANADIVKQSASGGSDAVSPDTKLNIWICNLTMDGADGLIGYAYPPAGAPNWPSGSEAPSPGLDGVVIDYIDVGGPSRQPKGYSSGFRGKAMVHEIGHYFGLRHIWGDDNGACQGQAGYHDDGITDTPVAADASPWDCDTTRNSCVESSGDLPDMLENFMDYSAPTCQNSFTKLQISTMEYVMDNIRPNVRVPLGIAEQSQSLNQVSLYPNPAASTLFFDFGTLSYQQATLYIHALTGTSVWEQHWENGHPLQEINLPSLPSGLYMAELRIDQQTTLTRKLIIQ